MLQTKEAFRDWVWEEKEFLRKLRVLTPMNEIAGAIRKREIELEEQIVTLTNEVVEATSSEMDFSNIDV